MKAIAKQACNVGGIFYEKGDEISIVDKNTLIRLNEKGLIEPLTAKQIQEFGKSKLYKKED